jgi:hypothetical protein
MAKRKSLLDDYANLGFDGYNPLVPGMTNSSEQTVKKKKKDGKVSKVPVLQANEYENFMKGQSQAYSSSILSGRPKQVTRNQINSINRGLRGNTLAGMTSKTIDLRLPNEQPMQFKIQKTNYGSVPFHYDARKSQNKLTEIAFGIPGRRQVRKPVTRTQVTNALNRSKAPTFGMSYNDKAIHSLRAITSKTVGIGKPISSYTPTFGASGNTLAAAKFKAALNPGRSIQSFLSSSAASHARLTKVNRARVSAKLAFYKSPGSGIDQANKILAEQGANYKLAPATRRRRRGRYVAYIAKIYTGPSTRKQYSRIIHNGRRVYGYSGWSPGQKIGTGDPASIINTYYRNNAITDFAIANTDIHH